MSTIFIIFIVVVAVAVAGYYIRLAMDKNRLDLRAIKRSIEDEERRKRMAEPWPPTSGAKEQ